MEKIGHVSNPLTVIAIFAGITEVGGTFVLPKLEPASQLAYVYFLMAFPSVLVLIFFAILYWKHQVLYAPSDFRTNDAFLYSITESKGQNNSVSIR